MKLLRNIAKRISCYLQARMCWAAASILAAQLLLPYAALAGAPPANTVIGVQAYADYYLPADLVARRQYSDFTQVIIAAVESLRLTGDTQVAHPPGGVVTIPYLLTNTGNVASDYTVTLANNGGSCSPDTLDLANLKIVRDTNNNGVADPWEVALTNPLKLDIGASASLLVVGDVPVSNGSACVSLKAVTALQMQSASVATTVLVTGGAALQVSKTATFSGPLLANSLVTYNVRAQNTGATSAMPAATSGLPTTTTIMVSRVGAPGLVATPLVLLRDPVPAGTAYEPNTLTTLASGALRLFHIVGDPAFSYRENADTGNVDEVAIGLPAGYSVPTSGAIDMTFQVRLLPTVSGDIVNRADAHYANGVGTDLAATSNAVILTSLRESMGAALSAGQPQPQYDVNGIYDGTAIVRLSARIHNYGANTAYDTSLTLPLQGAAPLLGTYTANAVPGAGQYTLVNQPALRSGPGVALNASYNGTPGNGNLLGAGANLAPGADLVLDWDVRINFTGVATPLSIQSTVQAARLPGAARLMSDQSHNGTDPDPGGLSHPELYQAPTPIAIPAALRMIKTAAPPVRVGNGVWEIDYTLTAVNQSAVPANNLRMIDNLACAIGGATGVVSWQLLGAPVVKSGAITINPGFTGIPANASAPCSANRDASSLTPLDMSVSLTNGATTLAPGATVQVTFKVRVAVNQPSAILTNQAWAASFSAAAGGALTSASSTSVVSLLVDPQGIVYDAITRQPITGATVTIKRESCSIGALGPITNAEVFPQPGVSYTFDAANRSVSMTTDATGEYQFFFMAPPLASLCDYSVTVTPPVSGLYQAQSTLIPPQSGVFATCGNVVPLATAPQAGDSTLYYRTIRVGQISAGPPPSICEVTHNNIPLDPATAGTALLLEKIASKKAVEFGDFLDYQLKVTNHHTAAVPSVTWTDVLPPGFAYVPGTTRVNGVKATDPTGGVGPQLTFTTSTPLAVSASATVAFRVRVGVGSTTHGDATNHAWAQSASLRSNEATATVRVTGGPFANDAYAFGKVFLDCNRNGEQDGDDELGIPGVRILLETGVSVTTDAFGRWSLYGLKPITHALRLDRSTLPTGAELMVLDNRNAGIADSRFLDLKNGEFGKANFVVTNCSNPALVEQVQSRRKALEGKPDAELDGSVKARIATRPEAAATAGPRNGLASGGIGNVDSTQTTQPVAAAPLIRLPSAAGNRTAAIAAATGSVPVGARSPLPASREGGADLLGPLPAPGVVELETLVPDLDAALGFIGLKDGDTVATTAINVRVKGAIGTTFRLVVNGREVGANRVGKKATLERSGVQAWEYIGVELNPGSNSLVVTARDDMGNSRGSQTIQVTAPDGLALILFDVPKELRADPLAPIAIAVRLTDKSGVPVTSRTYLTLEADRGRWTATDLNPQEPGVQVAIEGGVARFTFEPPADPGPGKLRATSNLLAGEADVNFLPQNRPLIGIGIVEGVLDVSRAGNIRLGSTMPAGAFEQELLGARTNSSNSNVTGRAAFYFKGAIKGEYLLTAAYDSDKDRRDRLFRDIKPDEYYPVYGDSSSRAFDAQSSQRVYVRIDKNRSYLLYGDFSTASSSEVRNLSQINRTLNGVKHQFADDAVRVTSFGSLDSTKQRIEEFPASGLSFYSLSSPGDIVANSEKVEIISRSRSQPELVVSTRTVARNVDYSFEPLSRRLQFVRPVSSVDADFNPQYIRVSFEVDGGGKEFAVGGVDAQFRVNDSLQLGVVGATDENPENRRELRAVTALARVGENTVVASELVQTHSDLKGDGSAGRVEIRHEAGALKAQAQATRVQSTFDNPGATVGAGRTEITGRAEYTIDAQTRLRAEALQSRDDATATATGGSREDLTAAVQRKLSDNVVAEVALRHGNTQSGGAGGFDYGKINGVTTATPTAPLTNAAGTNTSTDSLRARLTARLPDAANAEVFVEQEQSLDHGDQSATAVGGQYALTEKTRLYGRHTLNSNLPTPGTLASSQNTSNTIVGIESAYMEGGRIYNETRLGDAGGQNAAGVRNSLRLNERWSVTGGLEHTDVLSTGNATRATNTLANSTAGSQGSSNAVSLGAEYTEGPWRGSGAIENRVATGSESNLFSLGLAYKLNPDWTALARTNTTVTDSGNNGRQWLSRQQVGLAWRPANDDRFNGLVRLENRRELVVAGATGPGTDLSSSTALFNTGGGAALPGDNGTQIFTAVGNYNPYPGTYLTGRFAAKNASVIDDISSSSYAAQLAHLRLTRDLNADWDIGLQAGLLNGNGNGGRGSAQQSTLGVEVGYQFAANLWLSVGYNFVGLNDPDLTGANYTRDGAYIRLRLKFDENDLGRSSDRPREPRVAPRTGGAARQASLTPLVPLVSPPPEAGTALPAEQHPTETNSSALVQPNTVHRLAPSGFSLVSMAAAPAAQWSEGQPLPQQFHFDENQWFETFSSVKLSAGGLHLIGAIAKQAREHGVTSSNIEFSLGRGETDATRDTVWLRRMRAVRTELARLGLGSAAVMVDSQPLAPVANADQQTYRTGALVVALRASPKAVATSASGSAQ